MLRTWAAVSTIALSWGLSPFGQQALFRSETRTVAIYATAQGRDGELVTDLTRDEFQVLDNGAPVEIVQFSNDPQPITVVIMLDMSSDVGPRFLRVRDFSRLFLDALDPTTDRAALGVFGAEIAITPLATASAREPRRMLDEDLWPSGASALLWRAVAQASEVVSADSGRRVVVALSGTRDFDDCPTSRIHCMPLDVARSGVLENEILVYAVSHVGTASMARVRQMNSETRVCVDGQGDGEGPCPPLPEPRRLKDLALASGGGFYQVTDEDDLRGVATRLVEELRHQYVLGFAPAQGATGERRLDVRTTRNGVTLRARRSYLAGDRP